VSVYQPTPGSDFVIDVELPRVGRIKRSSEARDRREAVRREGMLRDLSEDGQDELLRALKTKVVSVGDLVNAKRAGKLTGNHALTDIKLRAPLFEAIRNTLTPRTVPGAATLRRYRTSAVSLAAFENDESIHFGRIEYVGDLLAYDWSEARRWWATGTAHDRGKSAADWNHLRRMLSRFLTLYLGDKYHPLRRQFMQLMPAANEGPGRLSALSLATFREMLAHVPEHTRPAYMTLLLTGMRMGEYLRCGKSHLRADLFAVNVPGTKTKGSAALVAVDPTQWDWIERGVPAPIKYQGLRMWWKKAARLVGAPDIRLHDIRHLSLTLALSGGAKVNEAQRHGRHATPTQTLQYTQLDDSREAAAGIARALTAGTTTGE
jgi:integrase